ncbi:hypothetical protein [Bradyrhizobium sp. Arg816]|uniref:hypothetical protein n=1 Tax=Bradyrhizobium sp. Arg816 TaxID=2998491 RepID=UPI00249DAC49|nr:hypothetical protein [Bradyrhizobium sp. Arg816]MDI3561210.1 hypothetical protein [Bradyrhizobium sp. Arg816]
MQDQLGPNFCWSVSERAAPAATARTAIRTHRFNSNVPFTCHPSRSPVADALTKRSWTVLRDPSQNASDIAIDSAALNPTGYAPLTILMMLDRFGKGKIGMKHAPVRDPVFNIAALRRLWRRATVAGVLYLLLASTLSAQAPPVSKWAKITVTGCTTFTKNGKVDFKSPCATETFYLGILGDGYRFSLLENKVSCAANEKRVIRAKTDGADTVALIEADCRTSAASFAINWSHTYKGVEGGYKSRDGGPLYYIQKHSGVVEIERRSESDCNVTSLSKSLRTVVPEGYDYAQRPSPAELKGWESSFKSPVCRLYDSAKAACGQDTCD